jgi:phosphoglucosamine mutase
MISASHNGFQDNGIKLLSRQGEKMDDATVEALERYLDGETQIPYATGADIGRTVDYVAGRNRYVGYLISLGLYSLKGMKVGLDCANGSAWNIARLVFDALGASTYLINSEPDGCNINREAGSTHMEKLQKFVLEKGLDVGFAYDGDADRCLCVDEKGNLITGDHILYIQGSYMKEQGQLPGNIVVTTVMSNLGLYKALDALGIGYAKTQVGDKYVYEYMMHGRVVIADTVHHIVPLKEDWNRRLDISNLMSLNHDTHSQIERDYEKYGAKVMACRLSEILGRYREQMAPSYH